MFHRRSLLGWRAVSTVSPIILAHSTNDFFSWGATNAAFISNTETDPLGGSTAFSWESNSTSFCAIQSTPLDVLNLSGGITYSLTSHFKIISGFHDAVHCVWLGVSDNIANNFGPTFDVVAGTVFGLNVGDGGDGTTTAATITSAGSGWWKCRLEGHFSSAHASCLVFAALCDGPTVANAPVGTRLYNWNVSLP